MKRYYKVTFEYSEGIYCTNLAHAETAEDVEREYSRYSWSSIKPAQPWDVDEARAKGMPIIEVEPAEEPDDAPAADPETVATDPAEAAQAAPAVPQAGPITAAMIASIGAPTPAQTVTVTWSNGSRATYSADMLDMLRTDPAALDIQDDTTGEMIYIKA